MRRLLFLLFSTLCVSATYAGSRAIRVALLADLHITEGNNNHKAMDGLVADINSQDFDLVVVAGDITNAGSDAELKCAFNCLKNIRHNQLVTHGNHETTWSDSGGGDFVKYWGYNGCTTARVGDYFFVAYPAGPYVKMADGTAQDGARLAWVEKQLKRAGKKRIVSVCHYPLNGDLTNRTEIVSLLRKYNVTSSLCGHYHEPRLMNFDSLPGIVGRSLYLPKGRGKGYGYTILEFKNDSIFVAEKMVGGQLEARYAVRQCDDATINSLPVDPQPEPLDMGGFKAERVVSDNASIYTAAQVVDGVLYYGNSAGEVKAYDVDTKRFIWVRKFTDPIYSTPILCGENIVVPTLSEGLVALNRKTGRVVWKNIDGNGYIGNGVVDDNYLYIGTLGVMRKVDWRTGKTVWSFEFSDRHPQGRPTIADGKLVFGAWDTYLYCVDCQSGTEIWRWTNGSKNRLLSPGHIIPRVANDRVMIVAPDRYMTNLDLASGRQIWRVKVRKVRESTGISADGATFYAKTMDGEMLAVPMNADSYTELWCRDVGWGYDHNFCPLMVVGDAIFMANRRGKVAAVSSSGEVISVGKFAGSAANDIRPDGSGAVWVSFIEGEIWRLSQ